MFIGDWGRESDLVGYEHSMGKRGHGKVPKTVERKMEGGMRGEMVAAMDSK